MTIAPKADLFFTEDRLWRHWSDGNVTVWWNGHAFIEGALYEGVAAAQRAATLLTPLIGANDASLSAALQGFDGHFAIVIQTPAGTLATVDRVRSIPVLIRTGPRGHLQIADRIAPLLQSGPDDDTDADASLAVAMAGYTLDGRTLYRDVLSLSAGEFLVAPVGQPARRHLWYAYQPWLIDTAAAPGDWPARLTRAHEALFAKLARSLDGRPVMLPLSGGYDSRLVVSGLHHVGYRNIVCYSYGRPQNEEAKAARTIAEKLALPWHYVAYDRAITRAALTGADFRAYLDGADTAAAIPFFQDFAAIQHLKREKLVPDGAVFINGNSGDFISGNHVPLAIYDHCTSAGVAWRDALVRQFLDKHFALWQDLNTSHNRTRLAQILFAWLERRVPADLPADMMPAAWEALEYSARQANFVINGQRIYEFFGHAWRLPLWDNEYVAFWQTVPAVHKRGQTLYRSTLHAANWGGVWSDIPLNPPQRWHLPIWAKWLRSGAKLVSAPFGRKAWRRVDRQIFYYWLDVLATYATASYADALFDRRGFRSALSFRGQQYLARHGRGADGQPP